MMLMLVYRRVQAIRCRVSQHATTRQPPSWCISTDSWLTWSSLDRWSWTIIIALSLSPHIFLLSLQPHQLSVNKYYTCFIIFFNLSVFTLLCSRLITCLPRPSSDILTSSNSANLPVAERLKTNRRGQPNLAWTLRRAGATSEHVKDQC